MSVHRSPRGDLVAILFALSLLPGCKSDAAPCVCASAAPSTLCPSAAVTSPAGSVTTAAEPPKWAAQLTGKAFDYQAKMDGEVRGSLSFGPPRIEPASGKKWSQWVVFDVSFATTSGDPGRSWVDAKIVSSGGEENKCKFKQSNPAATDLPAAGRKMTIDMWCPSFPDVAQFDFVSGSGPVLLLKFDGAWAAK